MTPLQAIRAIAALAPKEGDLPEWAKIAQKVSKDHEGLPYFPGEPDWFDEESAIAELLFSDILFANSRRYLCIDGSEQPETIVLFVLCNDLFGGGADAEQVTSKEIRPLYEAYVTHGHFGVNRWCCLKRGMRPWSRWEAQWREQGKWDAELEALPVK